MGRRRRRTTIPTTSHVPAPQLVIARRRSCWPVLVLVLLASIGLWFLDTHQPLPWPDAGAPWFEHARASSPVARGLDQLNGRVALTPDLPVGSALVLLVLGCSIVLTLLAVEAPGWLAVAVALGAIGTRSLWSTVTSGDDALPVLLVALAVSTLARPAMRVRTLAAVAVPLLTPAAAWLAAPALLRENRGAMRNVAVAAGAVGAGVIGQILLTRQARLLTACVDDAWSPVLLDALRPGLSADASAWIALRQWAAVLGGDVHLFGLAVAAFGLVVARESLAAFRRATLIALVITIATVAAGLLPPAFAAALLLPGWAPWFGIGLGALVERASARQRRAAVVCAVLAAAVTPPLRSATVVAGPWVAGTPAITRAVAGATRDTVMATDDAVLTRRIRMAGGATVAADRDAVAACLARGRRVSAIGSTVALMERAGFTIGHATLRAPLSDVLDDVREDQLVALAMAPSSLPWVGPHGLAALHRLDLRREHAQATMALGLVARTDRGGRVTTGRAGIELALRAGDMVAGHQLLEPVSVSARAHGAGVDSPPRHLAAGTSAAISVFDRAHEVELRSAASASPGLPVALDTHTQWRHAVITGRPQCVRASETWTALPGRMPRLGIPVATASPGRPMVAYMATDGAPHPDVHGLPAHGVWRDWTIDTFDLRQAADTARLRSIVERDEIAADVLPRGRWLVRVAIGPRDPWHPTHVAVTAGTEASWVVRLAGDGLRQWTGDVCRMDAAGERLFLGHFTVVDDDSPNEIGVWTREGWHAPELLRGQVHQWTSQPRATVGFRTPAPRPLVLAMDASAASPPSGPQRLTVHLNDHVISDDWQGAGRVEIPAAWLRAGENVLTLAVPLAVRPPGDQRTLGVLVRQLRLIDAPPR